MPLDPPLPWKHRLVPELLRLAWPITVSMLSYSFMTLVDTLFVGRLGAAQLAAVGVGGVIAFTLCCFGYGLLRSVKVVVSQVVGAGRAHQVPAYVAASMVLALGLGAVAIALGRIVTIYVPGLTLSGQAGHLAADYLWIRNLGAPAFLLAAALREGRYGVGDARAPMVAAVSANLCNIALDALLILGLGFGVEGAAWASVAAHVLDAALLVRRQERFGFGLSQMTMAHVLELARMGFPLGLQFTLEVGSFTTLVAILARAGEVDLAAHQIALSLCHFSFLPAVAIGEAASVLVGQAVGANRDSLVRRVARRALLMASVYTGACALLFVGASRWLAGLFTDEPVVATLAAQLLLVAAGFQLADGAHAIARSVLRGTGDIRFPAALSVAIAWLCTPTLAWLLGLRLGLGALGGWLGLLVEISVGALLLWWRVRRGSWLVHARRSRERLEAAQREPAPVAMT